MLLLDPPHRTRTTPIDDGLHLQRRVMSDFYRPPTPSEEVYHLICPGLERVSGLGGRREPKEVSRLDFLFFGLGRPVFIEDDTSAFSRFDDVEPFVLVAVPVWDGADVVGG